MSGEPTARVITGDSLLVMPTLEAESFDAIVCDPPYGLSFMGKAWDHGVPGVEFWREALRVAKPGAHLAAFGGSRTYHRLTCAIEDAGWEIRDCLSWLYGSGFQKSLDVSKAIDKAAGVERTATGERVRAGCRAARGGTELVGSQSIEDAKWKDVTEPASDAARRWNGYGTALKPAWEPIILARKPLGQTVAANVLEHSTGALNIDGCRIGHVGGTADVATGAGAKPNQVYGTYGAARTTPLDAGRWPANVCLDEEAAALLDAQTGTLHSGDAHVLRRGGTTGKGMGYGSSSAGNVLDATYGDSGGASRFYYTSKASSSERHAGLEHLPPRVTNTDTPPGTKGASNPRAGANRSGAALNHHPTVKPLDLMQWLCRLVTPKGGLILDPFTGSGSTGRAAIAEGFRFVGIELSEDYATIARARIAEYAPLFSQEAV